MERRILAELFVEDEKAIKMNKGTIDYAKDVIDYQCQECGISTGDIRILDDDDPKDTKARDLVDKILKLEENKPTFVYKVLSDYNYCFSVYQEGHWSENHYEIERVVY